ncbi:MAG: hypothetical protein L6R42_003714, partial [Xanthoria sp. 1 TBL-2021]
LVHPNGSVEVGLAGAATGDVEGVVDSRPVTDVVLEREFKETLTQRRFEQPNGKVAEEGCDVGPDDAEAGVTEILRQRRSVQLVVEVLPLAMIGDGIVDPGIGNRFDDRIGRELRRLLPEDPGVGIRSDDRIGRELRRLLPEDPGVGNRSEGRDPTIELAEKLGGYYQKILESVIDPTVSVEKLESVTDPTIESPLTVNPPVRGTIVGAEVTLLVGVTELRGVVPDAWQEAPTHKLRQASPEHEAADDVDALIVAGIDNTVLDDDVLIDGAVFVRETVQPAKFKQAFTQRSSVHVVVDAGAVRIVDRGLELPVRLGLEVAKIGDDGPGDVVPSPETLLVKDTVHPNPRFRQALTQRRSVQVAVITGVVVGFEVAGVVLVNCVNPDGDAVMLRPKLDVPAPVEAVELLRLGFGTQVGPIHRLRQSTPEHEGVGVKRVLVVPEFDNTLDETVGIATVDGMKADPEDMMVGDVPERADDNVDKDAVETKTGVLIVRLLVVLPKAVGLVTVLVGMMVEQPSPEQRVTHVTPLQDVVIENDKLGPLERTNVEEVNGVVRALKIVTVGLLKMVGDVVANGVVLDATVEIVPVDIEDAKFDEIGLEGMEVDMVAADVGKIKDEMVCWVVVVVQV